MSLDFLNIHPLLKRYDIHPKKSLGQNFLIEPAGLTRAINAAELSGKEEVLEIGAGLGSLTYLLAQTCASVTAVEIDPRMLAPLSEALKPFANVRVVQGDILELDPASLVSQENYVVVANIPYYITSALIRHILESDRQPSRLVLTVQKEVAQRICAEPGDLSLLALSVQVYGQPRLAAHIPASAFYPPPQVDSAVLRVDLYPQPRIPEDQLDTFFHLAKLAFAQKRKTLRNTLSAGLRWPPERAAGLLAEAGIDPMRRAETLSLDEWAQMVSVYRRETP